MAKKILSSLFTLAFATTALATPIIAAAPDGAGPWADNVISFNQALRKDGSAVLANRSNPDAALGVAENTNAAGTFTSLGFGGQLVLGFQNPVRNAIAIIETTNLPYPNETANVDVSTDGNTWTFVGNVTQDGQIQLPQDICARYIRITDTSNPAIFADDADGYDVDGVSSAQGEPCPTPEVPEFNLITMLGVLTLGAAGVIFSRRQTT